MLAPTITYKEVDPPEGLICDCGHVAPELFKRDGPGANAIPTKFFRVRGLNGSISGTYCEPCLIVINYVASQKKKSKKDKEENGG